MQMQVLLQSTLANTPELTLQGIQTWARILSAYDGDTLTMAIPFQNQIYKFQTRIEGIDTAEMKGPHKIQAIRARNRILQLLEIPIQLEDALTKKQIQTHLANSQKLVWVHCGDYDKYGRLLCKVFLSSDPESPSISQILIQEGHAYSYDGGTKIDPFAVPPISP